MKNERAHDETRTTERRSIVSEGMTLNNAISRGRSTQKNMRIGHKSTREEPSNENHVFG